MDIRVLNDLKVKQEGAQERLDHFIEQARQEIAIIETARREISRALKRKSITGADEPLFIKALRNIEEYQEITAEDEKESGGNIVRFLSSGK